MPTPPSRHAPGDVRVTSAERDLLAAYLTSFKPHGLVPILTAADLRAGDAVMGLAAATLCRGGDAFTNIVAWEAPATLPALEVTVAVGFRFALGVDDDLPDAIGKWSAVLRFDQVTIECVSRTALQRGLRPDAPDAIRRFFANHPARLDDAVMLLGQVFRARCVLRLRTNGSSEPLRGLQTLTSRHGLRLRPAAGGRFRQAEVLDLAVSAPRPVAFRPAFIEADPLTPDTFRTMNQMRPRAAARNFDPEREADLLTIAAWMDRQAERYLEGRPGYRAAS